MIYFCSTSTPLTSLPLGHDYMKMTVPVMATTPTRTRLRLAGRPNGTEQGMGIHVLEWVEDPREPGRVSLSSFLLLFFFCPLSVVCLTI